MISLLRWAPVKAADNSKLGTVSCFGGVHMIFPLQTIHWFSASQKMCSSLSLAWHMWRPSLSYHLGRLARLGSSLYHSFLISIRSSLASLGQESDSHISSQNIKNQNKLHTFITIQNLLTLLMHLQSGVCLHQTEWKRYLTWNMVKYKQSVLSRANKVKLKLKWVKNVGAAL